MKKLLLASLILLSACSKEDIFPAENVELSIDTKLPKDSNGYSVLRLTFSSFSTFESMNDAALTNAGLGEIGSVVKIVIVSLVIVAIFIGIFII